MDKITKHLPKYPYFSEITLEYRDVIESRFKQTKPYCDFSFRNLYIWKYKNKPNQFSILNNNLVIKVMNITGKNEDVSFLGINKTYETISTLLDRYKLITLVPEIVIESLSKEASELHIIPDEDNFDYIMSTVEIAELSGSHYKWKRRDLSKLRDYELKEKIMFDYIDLKTQEEILTLYDKWISYKQEDKSIVHELEALQTFLNTPKLHPNSLFVGIYDGKKLVSFTINELSHDRYAMGSFAKSDYNYRGVSSYGEHLTAKILKDLGYKYLNHEQDLGIENLRDYKNSWKPINFLKKYKIKKYDL